MIPEYDEYLVSLVEQENRKSSGKYDVESLKPLGKPTFKDDVRDSPGFFTVDGVDSQSDSIIIVSNKQFPDFVNETVEKTSEASAKLVPELSKHILFPLATGTYGTQSYVFWPRQQPISNKRLTKRVQLMTVNSRVYQWLTDVTMTTQVSVVSGEELNNQFKVPLAFLINQESVPGEIKRSASETIRLLDAAEISPVSILQHGDFWYGNILLERSWPFSLKSPVSFFIIDWGGANMAGYPYIDQLRYLMSMRQQDHVIARNLTKYSDECGIPVRDIMCYICAYAGYLGMNRNELPFDRYLKLIENLFHKAEIFSNSVNEKKYI